MGLRIYSALHGVCGHPMALRFFVYHFAAMQRRLCARREGIDLVLNSRVASVAPNKVIVVNSQTNSTNEIPFGACVWATGVAMHPLIKQLQVRCTAPNICSPVIF